MAKFFLGTTIAMFTLLSMFSVWELREALSVHPVLRAGFGLAVNIGVLTSLAAMWPEKSK